jgi:hydrogenase maturation protease
LPARVFRSSTHAFGVGDAVELSRALGRLPGRLVVYGVDGSDFAAGAALSGPVETAVDGVVEAILRDLEDGSSA